jgi:hypothetical protein
MIETYGSRVHTVAISRVDGSSVAVGVGVSVGKGVSVGGDVVAVGGSGLGDVSVAAVQLLRTANKMKTIIRILRIRPFFILCFGILAA